MRGATLTAEVCPLVKLFQSTRPMRGATTGDDRAAQQADISIHAPHAGRDQRDKRLQERIDISIHAPHAGRDCRR